jgi:hypothetical protein
MSIELKSFCSGLAERRGQRIVFNRNPIDTLHGQGLEALCRTSCFLMAALNHT